MGNELKQSAGICPLCKSKNTKLCASKCKANLELTDNYYSYVQCQDCQIITQMPIPSEEALSKYYQLIDEGQQRYWSTPEGEAFLAKIQRLQAKIPSKFRGLIRYLTCAGEDLYPYWHHLKQGSIVDLGAGSASFCLEARRRGWDIKGLEQSPGSVALANQLGFHLIEADIASEQAIHIIANADNVILNHVFEHVVDPISFLQMLRGEMKKGARLILLIPNPNSLWRYVFGHRWYGWDPPVHVHHYSAAALQQIIQSHGFQPIQIRSIRRNDSLTTALNAVGVDVGRLRFLLRILLIPVMPVLAWIGLGPELLCVAEVPFEDRTSTPPKTN